jgi:hypothetical protein
MPNVAGFIDISAEEASKNFELRNTVRVIRYKFR